MAIIQQRRSFSSRTPGAVESPSHCRFEPSFSATRWSTTKRRLPGKPPPHRRDILRWTFALALPPPASQSSLCATGSAWNFRCHRLRESQAIWDCLPKILLERDPQIPDWSQRCVRYQKPQKGSDTAFSLSNGSHQVYTGCFRQRLNCRI
jgi:hypothetical protein